MICPHCLLREAAGTLCLVCWIDADAEDDLDYGDRPLPPCPTETIPGTEDRLHVLEKRAALGYQLWHPDDRRWDWAPSPGWPAASRRCTASGAA